ncbi:unnamed protein product [Leptosia nina]|uniref:Uncharacterized protein n=1 Tax=Leptosia nina TaxID=320188 RepID=A0AAV1JQ77_9NEOP
MNMAGSIALYSSEDDVSKYRGAVDFEARRTCIYFYIMAWRCEKINMMRAFELKISRPTTVEEMKKKKDALMACYRAHLNKIKKSIKFRSSAARQTE